MERRRRGGFVSLARRRGMGVHGWEKRGGSGFGGMGVAKERGTLHVEKLEACDGFRRHGGPEREREKHSEKKIKVAFDFEEAVDGFSWVVLLYPPRCPNLAFAVCVCVHPHPNTYH